MSVLVKKRKKSCLYISAAALKLVINAIESNVDDDGEPLYQNHKVNYYTQRKRYLEDHAMHIVDRIIACFEEKYGNLFNKDNLTFQSLFSIALFI